MVRYVADVMAVNELAPSLFVELFAGGASVGLQLLSDKVVDEIGLVDRDRRVASFWKTAFWDTEWLLDQIDAVPLSLEEWRRHRRPTAGDTRSEALACLYLNRTSFSGIIAPERVQ
jgi:DNA adenine methylase